MKIRIGASCLALLCAASFAMPASAKVMFQRECKPDGIAMQKSSGPKQTTCIWKPADDQSMQVTLHFADDLDVVSGQCNFIPAANSQDKIIAVVGKKRAEVNNVVINGNTINFTVKNLRNDEENANVGFYVNSLFKKDYTPGDQLSCTFTPVFAK